MERKVADAACTMWMIEAPALGRASPIGVLRIEHDETHAGVVSVNMAAEARGHGLGAAALRAASERYLRNHADVLRVDAFIKPRNAASAGAFENAGFRFMEDLRIEGQQAWRYAFARDDLS
jgi:RimJ/RimL family protein N-acetyltransferase